MMTAGFDSASNQWSSLNTNGGGGGIHDQYQSFNKNTQRQQQSFGIHPSTIPSQSSQEKVEQIFNKKYFEGVIFNKQHEASIPFNLQYKPSDINFQSNGIGHQDFASNNEDELISSIAYSPQQHQANQSSIILNSNQKPPAPVSAAAISTDLDRQISDIISVIGRLNRVSCLANPCNGSQTNNSEDVTPSISNNMQIIEQPSQKMSKVSSIKSFASKNLPVTSRSPLQKFLTSTHSSTKTLTVNSNENQTLKPKHSLLYSKSPHKRPNLNQATRYDKSPTIQQKYDNQVAQLTFSASQGRLISKNNSTKQMMSTLKDQTYLNQDMISRLFINQQKQKEVKDQKVYIQRQKEMQEIQDRPSISPKSRDIALSSSRFSLPLYSPIRYQKEIITYQSRKEEAKRLKYLNDREKEISEDREMQAFFKSPSTQKLNRQDFLRKYNNQVLLWENRIRNGNSKTRQIYPHQDDCESHEGDSYLFKPQINPRSKELVKDMDKLENRVRKLQEEKQKKIQEISQKIQPTFRPKINPISTQIALESRKAITQQDHNQMLTNYLQRISEMSSSFANSTLKPKSQNVLRSSNSYKMLQTQKNATLKSYSPVNLSRPRKNTSSSRNDQPKVLASSKSVSQIATHQPTPHFQLSDKNFEDDLIVQEYQYEGEGSTQTFQQQEQQELNAIPPTDIHEETTQSQQQFQQFDSKESTKQQDENLQLYIQNYLFHTNLSQDNLTSRQSQQVKPFEQVQTQDINILQEYLKLKKEFDEQLSSRTQSQISKPQNASRYNMLEHPYTFDSTTSQEEEKQQIQEIVRESITTLIVEGQHDSFVKDTAIQVQQESHLQIDQQEVNEMTSDKKRHSKKGSNLSQYLTSSHKNEFSPSKSSYQTSPHPNVQQSLLNNSDSHLPLRNLLLTHSIQPKSIASLLNDQQPLIQQTTFEMIGAANGNLFSQQMHTKKSSDIEEVEELIYNIRSGINEIEESAGVYQTFQVQEQDKESSSSSSEEFIDQAGLDKISSKVGGSNSLEEETNSDELDKNWKLAVNGSAGRRLKKSSDYMKIVENQKNKMIPKQQQKRHRKSPTQQISKIPKKSILSRSSNLSGSGNQNPEVTKHEISGAQTYHSGAFKPVNEQYSLNTWNSPSKNKQLYDSQFKAYLLSQLSDQKMSEIAMYVDPETRQMIENSRLTLLQTVEKEDLAQYYAAAPQIHRMNESSQKQDEIVQKLIFSNKKQTEQQQHHESIFQQMRPLTIPREVYMEIEEYGLDTLSIIKQVIAQFPGILDQCSKEGGKPTMKQKARKQQKSAETTYKQYQTSMFVTFNKSKP